MGMETRMVKPGIWQAIFTGKEKDKPGFSKVGIKPTVQVDPGILNHVRSKVL